MISQISLSVSWQNRCDEGVKGCGRGLTHPGATAPARNNAWILRSAVLHKAGY